MADKRKYDCRTCPYPRYRDADHIYCDVCIRAILDKHHPQMKAPPVPDKECSGRLRLIPVSLAEANAFVDEHHRHHRHVAGHKFSLGCEQDGKLVGVAIVGRPVSRYLDNGKTLEVTRLCTTGEKNACSFLYGAAARAAKALGYEKIITYTLDSEPGTSLRAAGWKCTGLAGGLEWTGKRRPEGAQYPAQRKLRYEKNFKPQEDSQWHYG